MKKKYLQRGSAAPQSGPRGIAMIEVLVSMLIVALWLLASAGMQAGMFKLQKSAEFRLRAIELVTELGERMEANSVAAKDGRYALAAGATIGTASNCAAVACSGPDLAQYDLQQWSDRVTNQNLLLVDTFSVVYDDTEPRSYVISIAWKEPRGRQSYATGDTTDASGATETARYTAIKVPG